MQASRLLKTMKLKVAVLALGAALAGLLAASPAGAFMLLYSQDFDAAGQAAMRSLASPGNNGAAAPPGWVVYAHNAKFTDKLLVSDGTSAVWGGANKGYYATGDGLDYSLGIYTSSSQGQDHYLAFTYTVPYDVTQVSGSFEFEVAWSRFNQSRLRYASFLGGLSYSLNGGAWTPLISGADLKLSNAGVTPGNEQKWLTDAQMDALGLSKRRGLTFGLPDLHQGDTLTLRWAAMATRPDNTPYKNMLFGVDNFQLRGNRTPLPSTLILLGSSFLVLAGRFRRRSKGK